MARKRNPGAVSAARGARECSSAKISNPENSLRPIILQLAARRLAHRFGLTPPVAAVVAELAGIGGAP
jgi:hypothetical protein